VQTPGELEQSFWNRIKDSDDPADFAEYRRQFPKGVHAAEASLMARKLARTARAPRPAASRSRTETGGRADPPPAPTVAMVTGGPFPGYLTSTLTPGIFYNGSVYTNSDGTFEYRGVNGDRLRGKTSVSDSNYVVGTGISALGRQFGGIQNRYPDGSTSTQVTLRGRIINGVFEGEYTDKFQTGRFHFDLGHVN
jgi:hypothetical protein